MGYNLQDTDEITGRDQTSIYLLEIQIWYSTAHIQGYNRMSSFAGPNTTFAIVTVFSDQNITQYEVAIDTVRCYCNIHQYAYHPIFFSESPVLKILCPQKQVCTSVKSLIVAARNGTTLNKIY